MNITYTTCTPTTLVRAAHADMSIQAAADSEAAAHVADGHGTGTDHAGQFEERERLWLAVFNDQSIMLPFRHGGRGHVDGLPAALPRALREIQASDRHET